MEDLFAVNMDDFSAPTQGSNQSENLFKPDPNLSRDKVYSAVVRPIYWLGNPNGFNPKQNYISKKTFYLKNAAEEGGYFDSPFSIGEKCEAMSAFFKLKKEGKQDASAEDMANEIKPKSSFFYLVYVEKDLTTPENEGKIMVWKAPIQIHKLIEGKVNPDEKALKLGKKAEDVFNPFTGRSIEVNVSINRFWNYDGCEWGEKGPISYNGSDITEADKPAFAELVKSGDALMEPYVYKPMSAERTALLHSIIAEKTGLSIGGTKTVTASNDLDIDMGAAPTVNSPVDAVAEEIAAPAAETSTESAGAEEDINDFLGDLDLDV